jgi:hypothetical protein
MNDLRLRNLLEHRQACIGGVPEALPVQQLTFQSGKGMPKQMATQLLRNGAFYTADMRASCSPVSLNGYFLYNVVRWPIAEVSTRECKACASGSQAHSMNQSRWRSDMSDPIIYVDNSEILEGKFEALKAAMNELVQFVEANETQIYAYRVYFNEHRTRMTVIHIHPDTESLEFHMKVVGPLFPKFAGFVKLLSIDLYGAPSEYIVEQLRQKAEALGGGTVKIHSLHAGFARFPR